MSAKRNSLTGVPLANIGNMNVFELSRCPDLAAMQKEALSVTRSEGVDKNTRCETSFF
jgi:hypothetical protein